MSIASIFQFGSGSMLKAEESWMRMSCGRIIHDAFWKFNQIMCPGEVAVLGRTQHWFLFWLQGRSATQGAHMNSFSIYFRPKELRWCTHTHTNKILLCAMMCCGCWIPFQCSVISPKQMTQTDSVAHAALPPHLLASKRFLNLCLFIYMAV